MKKIMNLNDRGIAVSGILCSILLLFLGLITGVMSLLTSVKYTFNMLKTDIQAELNEVEADFCYEFDHNTGTILGYYEMLNGCGKDVVVPRDIDGIPVLSISSGAFNNKGLESVDLSSASQLKYIGGGMTKEEGAFANNKIKTVLFAPNSLVDTIGNYAFYNNEIEGVLNINDLLYLRIIGADAFANNKISSVDLSNLILLQEIDDMAFYNNNLLGTLNLANSLNLTRIGIGAFAGNTLSKVDTKGLFSLEVIDNYAFQNNAIESFDFTSLPSLKTIGRGSFAYNQLSSVNLSNTQVEKIKKRAFENNVIKSVSFVDTITNIGSYAFYNNLINGMVDLSMISTDLIGKYIFHKNSITDFKYAGTVVPEGMFANNKIGSVTSVKLPNVVTIGPLAFYKNDTLTTFDLSSLNSFENIESMAFMDCNISNFILKNSGHYRFRSSSFMNNKISGTLDLSKYSWVSVGDQAFRNNELTKVIFNNDSSKYSIGWAMFSNNKITGDDAFIIRDDELITYAGTGGEITIPDGVKVLKQSSLADSNITKVHFPSSITTIEPSALAGNPFSETLDLTDLVNVKTIGQYAFSSTLLPRTDSSRTESCSLYDSANDDYDHSIFLTDLLNNCRASTTVSYSTVKVIEVNNSTVKAIDLTGLTNLETIGHGAFGHFEGNEELIGTNTLTSLKSIEMNAFNDNNLKRGITFNNNPNLVSIGALAFQKNSYEDVVDLSGTKLTTIESSLFETTKTSNILEVKFPATLTTINAKAFYKAYVNKLDFSESTILTTIGDYAFSGSKLCDNGLVLPNKLKNIGRYAFQNSCINSQLVLPDSVEKLGWDAFYGAKISGKLVLPSSLETMEDSVFKDNSITEVDLSKTNITSLPYLSFDGNPKLTNIIFGNKIKAIGQKAFYNSGLKEITIPANIESIGIKTFNNGTLTKVNIESDSNNKIDRFNNVWNTIGFSKALMPEQEYYASTLSVDSQNLFDSSYNVYRVLIPQDGYYKLEAWGAQGGSYSTVMRGGYGGYASGVFNLAKDTIVYIYVGTQPTIYYEYNSDYDNPGGFNGGGLGSTLYTTSYGGTYAMGGGGATDFRFGDSMSLYSRAVVAGGGSGSNNHFNGYAAGGLESSGYDSKYIATQTKAGSGGSFGRGANVNAEKWVNGSGGGGGGGFYGGGTTSNPANATSTGTSAYLLKQSGGGSSYVYSASSASNYPSGCKLNQAFYAEEDTVVIYGGDDFDVNSGERLGNAGDGHASITYLGSSLTNIVSNNN